VPQGQGPTKLFIVTRSDISPGLQAAQSVHAALSFAFEHPDDGRQWHDTTPWVVCLSVPDERELLAEWDRVSHIPHRVLVREPDLDDAATSFAVLGHEAGRLLSSLPLSLRELVTV
jgi:hypothetical protein